MSFQRGSLPMSLTWPSFTGPFPVRDEYSIFVASETMLNPNMLHLWGLR